MTVYINGVAIDIAVHAALTTGVHGVGSAYLPKAFLEGTMVNKVIWKDESATALTDLNRTEDLAFTELDLSGDTSLLAKFAIIRIRVRADTVGTGNYSYVAVRKHGTTPTHFPQLQLDKAGTTAAVYHYEEFIVGLDTGQKIDYIINVGTGWQLDTTIQVLGYIE